MCQMSVVSEMISEEDIEAMKGELSRIQEYIMEAPESERRVLKAKAKEVKVATKKAAEKKKIEDLIP